MLIITNTLGVEYLEVFVGVLCIKHMLYTFVIKKN